MALHFDKIAASGKHLMNRLARELGNPEDSDKALRTLTAILHVMRDQMAVEKAVRLMSHLPLAIKTVFVHDWTPAHPAPKIKHADDFYAEVRYYDPKTSQLDFPSVESIEHATATVLLNLQRYVPPRDFESLVKSLPQDMKPLLKRRLVA